MDEYFVFWGYSVKENKYTSNLTSTSEWGMIVPCNSTKYEFLLPGQFLLETSLSGSETRETLPSGSFPAKNNGLYLLFPTSHSPLFLRFPRLHVPLIIFMMVNTFMLYSFFNSAQSFISSALIYLYCTFYLLFCLFSFVFIQLLTFLFNYSLILVSYLSNFSYNTTLIYCTQLTWEYLHLIRII